MSQASSSLNDAGYATGGSIGTRHSSLGLVLIVAVVVVGLVVYFLKRK